MTEENSNKLGELVDTIENIQCGLKLPMPPEFHLEQIKKFLPEWAQELKEIHISETGENPWEGNPVY